MSAARSGKMSLVMWVCGLLLWPGLASAWQTHVATAANTSGNSTYLDVYYANGNPNRLLLVTPVYNPTGASGVYNNHPIGVWYDAARGRWAIFNQDHATMPVGAAFSVSDGNASSNNVVHRAAAANISGHMTWLDNPYANGQPNAFVYVTANWNPGGVGGTYNSHPVGVWYDAVRGRWAIFNQDFAAMPEGASFNVVYLQASFVQTATAANTSSHVTFINNAQCNGNQTSTLFVTANWNPPGSAGVYNNHNLGTWYDTASGRWAIFNQDFGAMPPGASFNVWVLNVPW